MKKLNVKAVVIDLRHVSEETLASYEHIQIHAALAMTGPRTEALLAKYPVELDATSVQCYDDDACDDRAVQEACWGCGRL